MSKSDSPTLIVHSPTTQHKKKIEFYAFMDGRHKSHAIDY